MVSSGKILVVGIDAAARGFCAEALSLYGYGVEVVKCAAEALVRLNVSAFDAVVTDVDMPDMDGVDLYRRVMAGYPSLKGRFIFTGPFFPVDAETAQLASFQWISAPLRAVELFDAVNEVTGRKKTTVPFAAPGRMPVPSDRGDEGNLR